MHIEESLTAKGYTPGGEVPSRSIEFLAIHHWGNFGQTHDGVVNFFVNGPGSTSAHYVVSAGRVHCLVSPGDVAWHAGNWDANIKSVGLELRPEATPEDYQQAAELIAHLRAQFGKPDLPLRPHRDLHATACPGIWDLGKLDAMAREIANPAPAAPAAPVVTPQSVSAPAADQCIVDPGDSLTAIAAQFGVSLDALIAANPGIDPNLIHPGQVLNLPVSQCIVDPGDTLTSIARQFGVAVDRIIARNPGIDPNRIKPGQVLNL